MQAIVSLHTPIPTKDTMTKMFRGWKLGVILGNPKLKVPSTDQSFISGGGGGSGILDQCQIRTSKFLHEKFQSWGMGVFVAWHGILSTKSSHPNLLLHRK